MLRSTPFVVSRPLRRVVASQLPAMSTLYSTCKFASPIATTNSFGFSAAPRMVMSRRFAADTEKVDVVDAPIAEDSTDDPTDGQDPRFAISLGTLLVAGGIVLINLNERRAQKQELLDDTVEPLVVSLTDPVTSKQTVVNVKNFETAQDLDGLIFHAFGQVKATEPWARDVDLGVQAVNSLRLLRHVEMYQEVEHKEEHKDKDGKKTTTYRYTKEWKSSGQRTRDNRNPTFPHFSDLMEARELNMSVPNRPAKAGEQPTPINLLLSEDFVHRIDDFAPIEKLESRDNWQSATNSHMKLLPSGDKLYSNNGGEEFDPRIGDIRVTYKAVPEGEYTCLGFFSAKKGMKAVEGKLKESLAKSHGDLVIPEKAQELIGKAADAAGSDPLNMGLTKKQEKTVIDPQTGEKKTSLNSVLVIPDWLVEGIETIIMNSTPLEFAFIKREHATKAAAFQHNRDNQVQITNSYWYAGLACTGFGGACLGGAVAILLPASIASAGSVGGLTTGLLIARQTRQGAREQVEAKGAGVAVETVVGKKLEITTLEGHQTVLNIKEQIEMTENLPVAMQKLIFNGRPLVDTNTIEASGIAAGTTIHMVLALRAGF